MGICLGRGRKLSQSPRRSRMASNSFNVLCYAGFLCRSTVNFVLCLLMKPLLHLLEVAKLGPSTSYSSVYHIDYIITHTAR
ncbi:hypothetical protein ACB092_01G202200 [Castanea dentata]